MLSKYYLVSQSLVYFKIPLAFNNMVQAIYVFYVLPMDFFQLEPLKFQTYFDGVLFKIISHEVYNSIPESSDS